MQSVKKLKDNKLFKISLFITIGSFILLILSIGGMMEIGALINDKFYSCQEDPTQMNSVPCFYKYGIKVAVRVFYVSATSFLLTTSILVYHFIKKRNSN